MKKNRSISTAKAPPEAAPPPAGVAACSQNSGFVPPLAGVGIAAAALLAAFMVYSPALRGAFLFDDVALPFRAIPDYFRWSVLRALEEGRPLTSFSYWLSFHAGGGQPLAFHLASLVPHSGSATLVACILFRLMTIMQLGGAQRRTLAILGAGLFLLHPAQTEAVAYIAAHSETLSVFFYLAAIAVFLSRSQPHVSWPLAVGVLSCFLLAILSKEHALTLPAVLLLLDLWVYRQSVGGIFREGWRLYLLLAMGSTAGILLVLRTLAGAQTAGFAMEDLKWWEYLLTQGRAISLYARLWLLPINQNGDYLFPISRGPLEHGAVFYWLLIGGVLVAAVRFRRSAPLVALGIVLFLLLLSPTSSILPIQDAAVERRVYLASIGLLLATLGLVLRLRPSSQVLRYGGIALLVVLSMATFQRSKVWASGNAFWADVISKNPESWRANVVIGLQALEARRCPEALSRFEAARARVAWNFKAAWHVNYAQALDCVGRPEEAEAAYLESVNLERSAAHLSQLGVHYARRSMYPQALEALNEAIAVAPDFPPAWSNRGNLRARQGDCEKAIPDFERALQLMPGNRTAQLGLAYCGQQQPSTRSNGPPVPAAK